MPFFFLLKLLTADAAAAPGDAMQLTPFGRVFFRPELTFNHDDFDWSTDDTGWIFTLRTNLGTDVALPGDVHVVFDLTSYGTYLLHAGPLDPEVRLYQGYFELRDMGSTPLDLRVGRMELGTYGNGMLIAADDFYDGFSLDGWRLRYDTDRAVLDLVWNQLYANVDLLIDGTADADVWYNPVLFGTHDTVRFGSQRQHGADAYLWWLVSRPWQSYQSQTVAAGLRSFGQAGPVDYSVELAGQVGSGKLISDNAQTASIGAYAVEPRVGWRRGPVRLGLALYRASGDPDPSDDHLQSWNTMWEDPHGRYGNLDRYKGSNLQSERVELTWWPSGDDGSSSLHAQGYLLQVLEPADTTGEVFVTGTPSADADTALGVGADLVYTWPLTEQLQFVIDLSAFQPGAYVQETLGTSDLQTTGYLHMEARF